MRLLRQATLRDLLPFVTPSADEEASELAPRVEATAIGTTGDHEDSAVVELVASEKIGRQRSNGGSLAEPNPAPTSEPAMVPAVAAGWHVQAVTATYDAEARSTPKMLASRNS
jgi:hypothetical protein